MKKNKRDMIIENMNTVKEQLITFAKMEIHEIFKVLETSEDGLTNESVTSKIEEYGPNKIAEEKPKSWYIQFFETFKNPFIIVLVILGTVSWVTDVATVPVVDQSWISIIIIGSMILISVTLQFTQEYKSSVASEQLKNLVTTTAAIKRFGKDAKEIDMSEIVPGDILYLAAGDILPADVRVITCKDLFISQSALTGESEHVEKFAINKSIINENSSVTDLDHICLLGTSVISGSAKAVVIATGDDTYFGTISTSLVGQKVQTSFDKGVNSVSWLLIRFMIVMVPIVFFINGITKKDWLSALLFAISIAVGLTPEMLPMIVSTNLAKGALKMARKKTVVKSLSSIQNLGAMDILCTDKTGTLTMDKIVVEKYLNVHGIEDKRVLRHAFLNSYHQTGLRNLMDRAILDRGHIENIDNFGKEYIKVDEIPFDFSRRRMSVVIEDKSLKRQLITKGAVEEMLSICESVEYEGSAIKLSDKLRKEIFTIVNNLNNDGMRVIAVAQKNDIPDENTFCVNDESEMTLMGYVAFMDPPKESAHSAIKALQKHGIDVKVLTGDNEFVAQKVCKEVGLDINKLLLGSDTDEMSDEELKSVVKGITLFAKVSPTQKSRIIRSLQSLDHVVGFLGDGINDAPALREADVGISVDNAAEIAKESADIILLEKDLMVLEEGVIEGRITFGNIIKYIKMTASSNFGNVFSVLIASAFLPFLPMLPIHLLIQNLIYDISQIAIPWDTMDDDFLEQPQKWNADDIGKFMVYIGPISSLFDIITFAVLWFVFKANAPQFQSLFHSGWFIEGLLSQTLIVHMIRTKKIPFVQSWASKPLILLTALVMVIGVAIPFTAFGTSIGLQALPISYFPWLIGILILYSILTQFMKNKYIKKFGTWL